MDYWGTVLLSVVALFAVGVGMFVASWSFTSLTGSQFVTSPSLQYDYVIVGGGTAGGVLANRLSENGHTTVLVLEAGGLSTWFGHLPLVSPLLQESAMDWQYVTEPQTDSSRGLHDKRSKWPRGKGLGGSSQLNYMVHLRGIRSDYDRWNCSEWSYTELLPFFAMSETVQKTSSDSSDSGMRGRSGPLQVSQYNCSSSKICSAFVESLKVSGFVIGDLNGDVSYGAMPVEYNVHDGKRFSVYDAYIKPILDRPNVDIMIDTKVQKILFDGEIELIPRASGVQFKHKMDVLTVSARKEVILCAGVINTPHLLQVSGIGTKEELAKHSINPVSFLPVGENLQDHLNLPIFIHVENIMGLLNFGNIFSLNTLLEYIIFQDGPLVRTGVSAVARIKVPCDPSPGKSCNDSTALLAFALDVGSVNSKLYSKITNMKIQTFSRMFPDSTHPSKPGFVLMLIAAHPESIGHVKLNNGGDADGPPTIQPNYLEKMTDVQVLSYGIRFFASLMDKKPMQEIGAQIHIPHLQECNHFDKDLNDDRFLECWIRTAAITAYHPIGTCPMGGDGVEKAVVDCELNVKGVEGLRIVDASVFPSHIAGAPQATVVALAEKAAKLITEKHQND